MVPGQDSPGFRRDAEREPIIPAAGEIKESEQCVVGGLQAAVVAGKQYWQGRSYL